MQPVGLRKGHDVTIPPISTLDVPGEQQAWDVSALPLPPLDALVVVNPGRERVVQVYQHAFDFVPEEANVRPPSWTPEWRNALVDGIARILALTNDILGLTGPIS